MKTSAVFTIILLLIIGSTTCLAANWIAIDKTQKSQLFYDKDNFFVNPNGIIVVPLRWVYSEAQAEGSISYKSSIDSVMIDCNKGTLHIEEVLFLDGNDNKLGTKKIDKTVKDSPHAQKIVSYFCKISKSSQGDKPNPDNDSGGSLGTGFIIDKNGYIVSCNHVIEGKNTITGHVGHQDVKLKVVKTDSRNDIALLKMDLEPQTYLKFRRGKSIRPGEECFALGFPLAGLLAQEVNVTTGIISASSGLGNDISILQMTAPVQPGNSGGPLLDKNGAICGLVTSKLNAVRIAAATGDIPQNINFALNSLIIKLFLDSNSIDYEEFTSEEKEDLATIVEKSRDAIVLIYAR